ncbi:nickel-responsive transcriptional regulator NikR [bacterium]|nr:nickel-responsive transcriptional regulator NikR [bacterium]
MANRTVRFGVAMPADLVERFDAETQNFRNRSDALRRLVQEFLAEREFAEDQEVMGTLTLVYDHHRAKEPGGLTEIQHESGGLIHSTMHIHLDARRCLEVVVVRGPAGRIRGLVERLGSALGVLQARLQAAPLET